MERFEKILFLSASGPERERLCSELAGAIVVRLQSSDVGFHDEVFRTVKELRDLGHDLWSFDEDDDLEVWCPNYHTSSGPGLLIKFFVDSVEVDWVAE